MNPISNSTAATATPTHHRLRCFHDLGLHHMAYTEWGDPHNPEVVVCVHGLTRNGRDFDYLAAALAGRFRVICVDIVGRGESTWLGRSEVYQYPQYINDMALLLTHLAVPTVHWVGTSMGGLIGLMLAAKQGQGIASPIKKLVLNDIGPEIKANALQRIAAYVRARPSWVDRAHAEKGLRQMYATFGQLEEAQWQHLCRFGVRPQADGSLQPNYDPAIGKAFQTAAKIHDIDLWPFYDQIRCPVLVLRGEDSDVLSPTVYAEMGQRGPQARLQQFPNVGHAPALMDTAQIAIVEQFLAE